MYSSALRKRLVGGVLAMLTLATPTMADTIHPGGTINGPVVWSSSDNDHIATGTITINPAATTPVDFRKARRVPCCVFGALASLTISRYCCCLTESLEEFSIFGSG